MIRDWLHRHPLIGFLVLVFGISWGGIAVVTARGFNLSPMQAVEGGLMFLMMLLGPSLGGIARGELLRHFAERVWFPTALLPSQGVVWQAADDTSANATMTDGPITVTMLFRFGTEGLVESIFVEGRATTVGTETVLMPWECRMSNYQTIEGMRVPLTGEALHITPEGEKPYFKGTIETMDYQFAL